jgi:hypothetical protein
MRGNGVCHFRVAFNSSGVNSRSRFCAANPPRAIAMRVSAWLRSLNPAGKYRLPTNPLAAAPPKFAAAIWLCSESDLSTKEMPMRESFARVDSCCWMACNGNLHAREHRSRTSPSPAQFGPRGRSRNSCQTRPPQPANRADMLPADQSCERRRKLVVRIKSVDQRSRSRRP